LPPLTAQLRASGRIDKPARPWIGVYSAESEGRIVIAGVADRGPAAAAGLRRGDIVAAVGEAAVGSLADLYRGMWLADPPASKSRSKWFAMAAASGCAYAQSNAALISRDRASIDPARFAPACAAPHIQSKPRRSRRALPRSPREPDSDRH